ncbi:MAG: hypothetical protein WC359_12485 [Dehalococcoidia bacterium]|jgi:hypothetical protein
MGQCQTRDLVHLQTMADLKEAGLDAEARRMANNLNKSQQLALCVLVLFKDKGVPVDELKKIKEVLFWQDGDHVFPEFKNFQPFTASTIVKLGCSSSVPLFLRR